MIERQIEQWRKRGVIDSETADRLLVDYTENGVRPPWARVGGERKSVRRFSFFQVLIVFAAISFTAGIVLFIASNWEAIPRVVRAIGIISFIPIGLFGGYYVHGRFGPKSKFAEEACYLIAGGAFLSSVALVAQMYHISGDGRSAVLLYAAGLGLGAIAVRSMVFTGGALFFWATWHLDGPYDVDWLSLQFWVYFAALAIAFVIARYLKSKWAQKAVLLAVVAGLLPTALKILEIVFDWVVDAVDWLFSLPQEVQLGTWWSIFGLACVILCIGSREQNPLQKIPGFKRGWIGPQLSVGVLALCVLHALNDDAVWANYGVTAVAIGYAIAVLWLYGAGHRLIRYACYLLFVFEIYLLFGSSLASMVSTSGILILLALLLVAIAAVVYKLEKRFAAADQLKRGATGVPS